MPFGPTHIEMKPCIGDYMVKGIIKLTTALEFTYINSYMLR